MAAYNTPRATGPRTQRTFKQRHHRANILVILFVCALALVVDVACAASMEGDDNDINIADVVVRGPDWAWGDQDGGGTNDDQSNEGNKDQSERKGIVVEIVAWKGEVDPMKFGVRVVWMDGSSNVYRWGVQDKFDLAVVGKVSRETAIEMRERYYEKLHDQQVYQDLPISAFERSVLIQIFTRSGGIMSGSRNSTGASWKQSRGWETPHASDPCVDKDWDGVVCENGRVIAINLPNNGLRGRFAALPVKQLHALQSLNLAGNDLTGPIMPELSYLAKLRFVALEHNKLTSYIPDDIGRLTDLEWLSLESNDLIGRIPTELGNKLTKLQHLRLGRNRITGTVPHSLAKISSLRTLFLEHTQLTGELPAEFSPKVAAVAAEVGSAFAEAQGPISESDTRGTVVQNDQIATQARVPLHLRVRPGTRLSAGPELTAALLMADGSLTAAEQQKRRDDLQFPRPEPVKLDPTKFQWDKSKFGQRPEVDRHPQEQAIPKGNSRDERMEVFTDGGAKQHAGTHEVPRRPGHILDPTDPRNYHWGPNAPVLPPSA